MSFSYELSQDRIAQRPCHPPEAAKMLVVNRQTNSFEDLHFFDLPSLLRPDDLLVFNDTRVIAARLLGHKGQVPVEIFLLNELSEGHWETIGKPLKRLKAGSEIFFSENLKAVVKCRPADDRLELNFLFAGQAATRQQILDAGMIPIPPYIRGGISDAEDVQDYQTIFARKDGSVAAPTASLHFSQPLINKITAVGCKIDFLTLHVGLSSIKEVEEGKAPESERFSVSRELKEQIVSTKESGGRVIAVGTTVVRALESIQAAESGAANQTNLFITPGFKFRIVDLIVTNFHFPKSTHLLLVEAFMQSTDLIKNSYNHALLGNYRFLSYGDGMVII